MEFIEAVIQYGFLQKALLTSIMVGIICGVIGCFIILRGMALMGDAISHAVLPGVAISYMLGINFFFGAVFSGVLTALAIGFVTQNSRIKHDTSIGIMFTAAFASGIIMITLLKSSTDLYHILFGNVLAVRSTDMWITLGIGLIVIAAVYLFYKELLVTSFDETMGAAYGLPVRFIHYFLMLLANRRHCISCRHAYYTCSCCLSINGSFMGNDFSRGRDRNHLIVCWSIL